MSRPTSSEDDRRRRRLLAALESVLPERTRDESGDGWGGRDRPAAAADEDWLRDQVPPHHG
jgi:hypothetical protein